MHYLPNIEPSGFHRGEYVGYREGRVFRIKRGGVRGNLWVAMETQGGHITGADFIFARTLKAMSDKLAGPASALHH